MPTEDLLLQSLSRVEDVINRVDDRLRADLRHLQDEVKIAQTELALARQQILDLEESHKGLVGKIDAVERSSIQTTASSNTIVSLLTKILPFIAALAAGAGAKPVLQKLNVMDEAPPYVATEH